MLRARTGLVLDRNHPGDAEPVLQHPEFCRPERLLQRHGNQAAFTQRSKDTLGLGLVRQRNREGKASKSWLPSHWPSDAINVVLPIRTVACMILSSKQSGNPCG